jgi:NAD(P)-dependent dehydrogenase (short-subunit alcohol dehydrogenase family)
MAGRLEGKVALITGGGGGIGRDSAQLFAAEGAKVVVFDLNENSVNESARLIKEAGGEALALAGDVSKADIVKDMIETTVQTFGGLDVLFNNAGVGGGIARLPDVEEENWDKIMNINVKGVWLGMKYGIPKMKEKGGSIINTASVAGLRGTPNLGAYGASKAAVVQLTKTGALEWARYGIRVNCICPAFTRTNMVTAMFETRPENEQKLVSQIPFGRLGQASEVAYTALFLATDEARFLTGAAIPVDGGLMAG